MFSVDEFEQQLARWRDLERLALAAEEKFKAAGQMAASAEAAAAARDAADRRHAADDYLAAILGTVNKGHPPASNDGQRGERKSD